MSDRNDLYTDYALQMFSSYLKDDLKSMELVLESFKSDGKATDSIFMPGIIYGLMFHWATTFRLISSVSGTSVEKLLEDYAMDYAIIREDLIDNPLLNVHKAKETLEQILASIENLEKMLNEEDF